MKFCDGPFIIFEAVREVIISQSHIIVDHCTILSENIIADNLICISLIVFSMYNSVLFKKYLLVFTWNGDHPFKRSAFFSGGVKNLANLPMDSSKKTVKICQRLKWMVPCYSFSISEL